MLRPAAAYRRLEPPLPQMPVQMPVRSCCWAAAAAAAARTQLQLQQPSPLARLRLPAWNTLPTGAAEDPGGEAAAHPTAAGHRWPSASVGRVAPAGAQLQPAYRHACTGSGQRWKRRLTGRGGESQRSTRRGKQRMFKNVPRTRTHAREGLLGLTPRTASARRPGLGRTGNCRCKDRRGQAGRIRRRVARACTWAAAAPAPPERRARRWRLRRGRFAVGSRQEAAGADLAAVVNPAKPGC